MLSHPSTLRTCDSSRNNDNDLSNTGFQGEKHNAHVQRRIQKLWKQFEKNEKPSQSHSLQASSFNEETSTPTLHVRTSGIYYKTNHTSSFPSSFPTSTSTSPSSTNSPTTVLPVDNSSLSQPSIIASSTSSITTSSWVYGPPSFLHFMNNKYPTIQQNALKRKRTIVYQKKGTTGMAGQITGVCDSLLLAIIHERPFQSTSPFCF